MPLRWRMGRNYWQLKNFLDEAQWWDRARIEAWQLARLQKIVAYAYEQTPGYREVYQKAGVQPEDLQSLEDIKSFPFITKNLLKDNIEAFSVGQIPNWKRYYDTTGGSSGTPLGFYKTKTNLWVENAFIHSGWERTGWQVGNRLAVLKGWSGDKDQQIGAFDPLTRELRLSSYHLSGELYSNYIELINYYQTKALLAYPSSAAILADLILEFGDAGRIRFEQIFLVSENIHKWQIAKMAQAFPEARTFGLYGQTEQVCLAQWCEKCDDYHIWPFYGLTELVTPTTEINPSDNAQEIVATSFWNEATPLIRYRTGDLARLKASRCDACQREFDILENIEGRDQDYVITKDGIYITLTALVFAQHFNAFGKIKAMQLAQSRAGEVLVRVIPSQKFVESDRNEIKSKMEQASGGQLSVSVVLVDEIQKTQRGKTKFLDQKLKLRY